MPSKPRKSWRDRSFAIIYIVGINSTIQGSLSPQKGLAKCGSVGRTNQQLAGMMPSRFGMNVPQDIIVVFAHGFLTAYWLKTLCCSLQPGWKRFLAALPVIAANTLLPFVLDGKHITQSSPFGGKIVEIYAGFLFMWLANCKVVAFCLNRGFLADVKSWPYWKFAGVYMFPIIPKTDALSDLSEGSNLDNRAKLKEIFRWLGQFVFKMGMLFIIAYLLSVNHPGLPWKQILHDFGLCFWLGGCFDLMQAVALAFFDIDTHDSFNYPWMARDLGDLWSTRWNLVTAKVLKPLSYDLIIQDTLIAQSNKDVMKTKKPEWKRAMAVCSIFLLSGAVHCVFFWYVSRKWIWEWMVFFTMFGPLLIIEGQLKKVFVNKFGFGPLPPVLRVSLTFGTFTSLAGWLFFPPTERIGMVNLAKNFQQQVLQ